MKPIIKCKKLVEEMGLDFIETLDEHLTNGWVYSGDDAFIMASVESHSQLLEKDSQICVDKDTWFVYFYVGSLRRVLGLVPFKLKFVAFRRNNGAIKLYEMDKLLQKMENL